MQSFKRREGDDGDPLENLIAEKILHQHLNTLAVLRRGNEFFLHAEETAHRVRDERAGLDALTEYLDYLKEAGAACETEGDKTGAARYAKLLRAIKGAINRAVGSVASGREPDPTPPGHDGEMPDNTPDRTQPFVALLTGDRPSAPPTMRSRGITKQQAITAFSGMHFNEERWSRNLADPPKWLADCRVARGNKNISAMWNPVFIALALLDKGVPLKRLDSVFVRLRDWAGDWSETSDVFR